MAVSINCAYLRHWRLHTIIFASTLKIWFLLLSEIMIAQTIQLNGTVLNKETKAPVSLVNIFTLDHLFGTVSTSDGMFSLTIPVSQTNNYLYFTSIGYETDSLLISRTNISPTVYLMPKIYTLKEVTVMPDSTLRTLLRKAYSKIPDNYPSQPTRYKGFYQESTSDEAGSPIKLVEAELSVYKESYRRRREAPGQVEIVKSRIAKLQSANIGYIGGAFLPVEEDIVLQRSTFIQPEYFKNYRYELVGIKSWNDQECYEIAFYSPDKDSVLRGTMLIDLESLAYISFEVSMENPENAKSIIEMIGPVDSKLNTEYEQYDGIWHLKYVTKRARHEHWRMKQIQNTVYAFVTTHIQTDSVRPVPVEKRLKYMDPIEVITEAYNPKGWTDSEILTGENPEHLRFQFSTDEASSVFNQNVRTRKTFAETMANTLPKLITGYGVQYDPKYELAILQGIIGYRFNKKWSVQGKQAENFYDQKRTSLQEISLGVEYRKNLNNAGYPVYFESSLWVSHNLIRRQFHPAVREQTIVPQLSLSKQASNFFTFEVFVNYPVVIHANTNDKKSNLRAGMNLYFLY